MSLDTTEDRPQKILIRPPEGIPAQMVTDYVNRCIATLPSVAIAIDLSDYGQLVVFGHRLKGSGGGYGIPALTEFGSAIQEAGKRSDMTELRRQVIALKDYLDRIVVLS